MKETLQNLKKVYKYGKKYKKALIYQIICCVFFITFNITLPIITSKQLVYLTDNLFNQLFIATLMVFIINIFANIFKVLLRRNTQIFFRGTTRDLQIALGKEILKIEVSEIDKNSTGTFVQRLGSDTDELSRIFTAGMGHLTGILTDIGIFVAVFVISRKVFIFYLIASIILTIIHLVKVKKVGEKDVIFRKQRDKTSGLSTELIRGVRDIKMLNAKKSFMNDLEENINDLSQKQFDMRNLEMDYKCLVGFIEAIFEFLIVIILVCLIDSGELLIANAIVLFSYRNRLLNNLIEKTGELLTQLKSFNIASKRVFAILENKEFKKEKFGKKHLDKVNGDFEFKNVLFGYNENEVLKDLSFKVNANETVAFVGKSGAGKTTIFSLLCKLYDINDGVITIDGIDIKELDEESIRNNITIISQNPYIFNMSINDNLRLVKENITDEEIKKACKLACLDEFIETLPDKYDTVVGEGGIALSGGQRQRLAIARAFIQETEIILFDEATSALDNETQSKIQQAINNLKENYTILIIAHRFSTIINSDRILVIDDGKIVGEGTHEELLKSNKIYKKLYESEQFDK
ncbi:MAG: ABC transporter ATP-binding protein [Firmicutes bacterium]|nr:ABC transporter ATP-binding protein [Bacillota bacterium]